MKIDAWAEPLPYLEKPVYSEPLQQMAEAEIPSLNVPCQEADEESRVEPTQQNHEHRPFFEAHRDLSTTTVPDHKQATRQVQTLTMHESLILNARCGIGSDKLCLMPVFMYENRGEADPPLKSQLRRLIIMVCQSVLDGSQVIIRVAIEANVHRTTR